MNLTILFSAISFVGGTILGGYLASRKLTRELSEWRETLEEENQSLRDEKAEIRKKLEGMVDKYAAEADARLAEDRSELAKMKPDLEALSRKYRDADFDAHFAEREYPDEVEDEDDDPDDGFYDGGNRPEGGVNRPPFEISPDELEGEFSDSELTTITFYQGDEMLLDDRGELISDVAGLLGSLVAEALPTCTDEYIYVHNDAHDTNYEVIITQESSGYLDTLVRGLDY